MTKSELIDEIASHYSSVRHKDIEGMVNAIFDTMTQCLARNDRIEIRGLGIFVAKKRKARMARNPRTNESVKIPEKFVPFSPPEKSLESA